MCRSSLFIPTLPPDSLLISPLVHQCLSSPLSPPLLLYSHLTSLLLLELPSLSQAVPLSLLPRLSSHWPRSQFPARPQGLFPVCPGAGGNLSRETNCLVAASCEHLAQLGTRSRVTPPETECGRLHAQEACTRPDYTRSRQCRHLPSTTMGHKVM